MSRAVTERDFRLPEFRNANVEDYEIRGDGKVVRKDRWETGIREISRIVRDDQDWEISDIVEAVRQNYSRPIYDISQIVINEDFDINTIEPGVYQFQWGDVPQVAVGVVGVLHDGKRWYTCSNWTNENPSGCATDDWRGVSIITPLFIK